MFGFISQIIDLASSDVPFVDLEIFWVVGVSGLVVSAIFGFVASGREKKYQFYKIFDIPANLSNQEFVGRRVAFVLRERQEEAHRAETQMIELEAEINRSPVEDSHLAEVRGKIKELRKLSKSNDYYQKRFQIASDVAQQLNFELTIGSDGIWVTRFGLNLGVA